MPEYRFHSLPVSDASALPTGVFYRDAAALTWGLRQSYGGVEVWEADRFVGRVYPPDASTRGDPALGSACKRE